MMESSFPPAWNSSEGHRRRRNVSNNLTIGQRHRKAIWEKSQKVGLRRPLHKTLRTLSKIPCQVSHRLRQIATRGYVATCVKDCLLKHLTRAFHLSQKQVNRNRLNPAKSVLFKLFGICAPGPDYVGAIAYSDRQRLLSIFPTIDPEQFLNIP